VSAFGHVGRAKGISVARRMAAAMDIDEGLYSRQLYVLGHDAMRRMQVMPPLPRQRRLLTSFTLAFFFDAS